jgi:hypothetical protein
VSTPTKIHHWAIVWDAVTAAVYMDGAVVLSEPAAGALSNQPAHVIVGSRGATDKTFLGTLAGFAYYSHALTPGRILAHAQAAAVA